MDMAVPTRMDSIVKGILATRIGGMGTIGVVIHGTNKGPSFDDFPYSTIVPFGTIMVRIKRVGGGRASEGRVRRVIRGV